MAKAIFTNGRFVAVTGDGVVFALENAATLDRAQTYRPAVEAGLAAHFGRPVSMVLIEEKDAARYAEGGSAPPVRDAAPPAAAPTPDGNRPARRGADGAGCRLGRALGRPRLRSDRSRRRPGPLRSSGTPIPTKNRST